MVQDDLAGILARSLRFSKRAGMAKDHLNPESIESLNECLLFVLEEHVPVALLVIGGLAMELYGLPRNTDDIDAVSPLRIALRSCRSCFRK